jgi:adenylylsulfate kinase-like enzyme
MQSSQLLRRSDSMGNKPPRVSSNDPVPHQPPYVFLYGVAGVGKSFCAELLARRLGYKSYDLDQHVTPAMQAAAREGRSFTDEMRDQRALSGSLLCRGHRTPANCIGAGLAARKLGES